MNEAAISLEVGGKPRGPWAPRGDMPLLPPRRDEGPYVKSSWNPSRELLEQIDAVAASKRYTRNEVVEILVRWACDETDREDALLPSGFSPAGVGPADDEDERAITAPLRMPVKLIERVDAIARRRGRTRNTQLVWFLRWGLAVDQAEDGAEKTKRKRK